MNRRDLLTCNLAAKSKPAGPWGAEFYTNAVLRTQDNKPVRFHDDLIQGKISLINFFYASCHTWCPRSAAKLSKVQKMLGDRVGRDIFMYSISLKPWEDDPATLKRYAQSFGAKPGWFFLTGDDYDITTLRFKLLRLDQPMLDFDPIQHTGMVRIINAPLTKWTMCPLGATVQQIVDAVSWVEPTPPMEVRLRQNAAKQAKIDEQMRVLQPQWAEFRQAHGWSVS
jgi:protein SCO1/2